jgi:hypothetical protein
MTMLQRILLGALALGMTALLNACATPLEATADYDDSFDFSGVSTIGIQPYDRSTVSSVRISDMQVDRINVTLSDELERKGLRMVENPAEADLVMTWHLVTQEKTDVRTYNSASYYNCWRCGPNVSDVSVRQYTEGTFIVDMIDPNRNRSVWRSVIKSKLKSEPDLEKSAQNRREAASAIFAEFPPL